MRVWYVSLDAKQFIDEQFGLPTVQDIFKELEKPGRDPRGEFKTAVFAEGVEEITDLKPGMILEGTGHQCDQLRRICGYWCSPRRFSTYFIIKR